MKTKQGIYLNLNESDYTVMKSGLIFYFSSETYKQKFLENVDNYINEEIIKLKNKYQVSGSFEIFLMVSYYKKIEKRGFRIFDDINKKELTENVMFINQILSY